MADQFEIPQRTPPAPQFQPPTDLVNAYLARPTGYQVGSQQIGQGVNDLLQNYYKQKELKMNAFKAGGPALMHQMGYMNDKDYGDLINAMGDQSQGQPPAAPQSQGPVNLAPPQQTQSMPGGGISAGQPSAPLMHPTSGLPQTIHDVPGPLSPQSNVAGNPMQGQHANNIKALQSKMSRNVTLFGPEMGGTMNKALTDQLGAEKALMEGEQFNVGQQRQSDQFTQSQNAEEDRFNRGQTLKKNEAIATKGAEQKPAQIQVDLLEKSFKDLDSSLKKYYSGPAIPGSGNLAKATGGHLGSKAGKSVIEDSEALVSNLNKALTSRFGLAGQSLLSESYKVSPNETPDSAADKMRKVHSVINILDSANKEQISNFIADLNGNVNAR